VNRIVDIVFDGPPGPEAGRFVEVESPPGTSIGDYGEWVHREDGYWVLRVIEDDARVRADERERVDREWCMSLLPEGPDAIARITRRHIETRDRALGAEKEGKE
jgi:hypothetical protein